MALTDSTGTVVASYSYDTFGILTSSSESFLNDPAGWTNPYRYDGRDGVRYDSATGLYWMDVGAGVRSNEWNTQRQRVLRYGLARRRAPC